MATYIDLVAQILKRQDPATTTFITCIIINKRCTSVHLLPTVNMQVMVLQGSVVWPSQESAAPLSAGRTLRPTPRALLGP